METQTTNIYIIFDIIHWILGAIVILGIVGILPMIGIGIYFFVKSSKENDTEKKALLKKKGTNFVIIPFIMIIGSFILLLVLRVVNVIWES